MKRVLFLMSLMVLSVLTFAEPNVEQLRREIAKKSIFTEKQLKKKTLEELQALEERIDQSKQAAAQGKAFVQAFLEQKKATFEERRNQSQTDREKAVLAARDNMLATLQLTKEKDQLVARMLNRYMQWEEGYAVEVAFDNQQIEAVTKAIREKVPHKKADGKENTEQLLNAVAPLVYMANALKTDAFSAEEKQIMEVYLGRIWIITKDNVRLPMRAFILNRQQAALSEEYFAALNDFLNNVEDEEDKVFALLPSN